MASVPTACPLDCPDACGVLAETADDGRLVRVRGNPAHGYTRGALCGKTALYGELVHAPERLLAPLLRRSKREPFREATWDEALAATCDALAPLAGEDVLALSYGGTMGFVQRKLPLRLFHALGATLHDGGICDAASTAGYEVVLGRQIGPDIEELGAADLVLIWGADVVRTMPHVLPALKRLCAAGVPVVAVDVWRSDTIRRLEAWGGSGVVLAPGTDAMLALALARLAFERGDADLAFLERECLGAEAFEAHVRSGFEPSRCEEVTGVPRERLAELAALLGGARAPFLKVGIGWTRRRNGAMGMRAVCSLGAVLGHAGRVHYESGDHFALPEEPVTRPDLRPAGAPPAVGVRQVELGRELSSGRFRAVCVWAHNPAVTLPDAGAVRRGLAREDLFVVVHEHFMTETAELANVVLPATTFVEHADLYRSYGHRRLQLARKACEPPGAGNGVGPRSNVATFTELARRLGLPRETWDVDAERAIEELLDASAERFTGDELERLRAGEPVKLAPRQLVGWGTPSGRVELVSETARAAGQPSMATYVPDPGLDAPGGGPAGFWLIAAPSVDTHNSTFVHGARHARKAWGDAGPGGVRAFLNPDDAAALDVVGGTRIALRNARGRLTFTAALTDDVPRGAVRVDGLPPRRLFPEGLGLNALTGPEVSDLGDGNTMYSARVDVERVADEQEEAWTSS